MNKGIFLLCLAIASCSPFFINTMDYEYQALELYTAWAMMDQFDYENKPSAYYKSPKEMEADGYGNCGAHAVYMVYLLGNKASLVIINQPPSNHSIVKYNGLYIEPQIYDMFYAKTSLIILEEYSYDYIMRYATRWGTKSLN